MIPVESASNAADLNITRRARSTLDPELSRN